MPWTNLWTSQLKSRSPATVASYLPLLTSRTEIQDWMFAIHNPASKFRDPGKNYDYWQWLGSASRRIQSFPTRLKDHMIVVCTLYFLGSRILNLYARLLWIWLCREFTEGWILGIVLLTSHRFRYCNTIRVHESVGSERLDLTLVNYGAQGWDDGFLCSMSHSTGLILQVSLIFCVLLCCRDISCRQ